MKETLEQVVRRFQKIYLGDSLIEGLIIDFQRERCTFLLNAATVLKNIFNPNIFDPEQRYQPAALVFYGTRSISCLEGEFFLNYTIVDFDATLDEKSDLVRFRLQMTGGIDNESFIRSILVTARDFSLGSPSTPVRLSP